MTNEKTIDGFGYTYTVSEWANLLDLSMDVFKYYTEEKGLTVEDLYEIRGFNFVPKKPKQRKPRQGARMEETKLRMYLLLLDSGYLLDEGQDQITVKPLDNNGNHFVAVGRRAFGTYNYREGTLKMKTGNGIPLRELDKEGLTATVIQTRDGGWDIHPDTQRMIVSRALAKLETRPIEQAEYDRKRENNPAEPSWNLYEGFGEKHTIPEWARRLGIPRNTAWRYFKRGLTVEEIAEKRGVKYP